MTSTNFNIGLGDTNRNSSRVLKPPGGGTSDLFGADSQDFSRKQLGGHHVAAGGPSPVSSTEHPSSPVNFKAGMNSYDRLFGAPQPNISKNNYRNPLQSQISFGNNNIEEEVKFVKEVDNGNTDIERKEEPITTPDGNPVTGEGYELPKNGQPAAIIPNLVNGDVSTPTTPITPPLKNRVPPGGYSSGLW